MKKMIKYLLLAIVLIPVNAFAADFNIGEFKTRTDDGDMFATLTADVTEGNDLTDKPTVECNATHSVQCSVEVYEPPYKSTDPTLGMVNIKNTSDQDLNGVTVIVTFNLNGQTVTKQKVVNIKAGTKPKSTNSKLKGLKTNVGTWNIQFSSDTYEYTIYDIRDSINRIVFTPTCAEGACRVSYEGGVGSNSNSVELPTGNSTSDIKVIVKSEATDGAETTTTYKLSVIKGTSSYNSTKLKSLKVGEYTLDPEFSADTLTYTVKIPTKVSNIESLLSYETEDANATVKVEGANKLDSDTNTVKIIVTSRDGANKQEYVLTVIKENDVEEVIEVIGYKDDKVTFMNAEGVREELPIDEFKEKYPSEYEKIDNGTYKFDENGNIIKENNDDNKNEEKKKNSFPWIIVILIVVAIIIIAVAGYFIFRDPEKSKKKKKDGKKDNKEDEEKTEITEEQIEELNDIDSYNEEARLIAEDNQRNENPLLDEDQEEIAPVTDNYEDITEEVVREETVDDYVDEEKSATMDIDEALSDLMNTKEYNFKDK